MITDEIKVSGRFEVVVFRKDGTIKDYREVENLILDAGKAQVAALIGGIDNTPFKYMGIGTGTTPAVGSDTTLENEIKRKAATITREATNVANDTVVYTATFSAADGLTGTAAVTESGLFNASTGGVLLNRKTFAPVNCDWDAGDSLQLTWKVIVQ